LKTRIIVAIAVSVVLIAGVVVGVVALVGRSPSTQYPTARVMRMDVTGAVTAIGGLSPVNRYGVAFGLAAALLAPGSSSLTATPIAKVRWTVLTIKVAAGQAVLKGAVLATASTTDARAQLATATSDLQLARIHIAQAETDLANATDPVKIHRFQTLLANARAAESTALRLQSDLTVQLSHATLVAPAAGVVEAVNIIAAADAPLGQGIVLDVGGFQAVVSIGEGDLAKLSPGMAATVTITALGQSAPGSLASIGFTPSGASAGGPTYPVTFKIPTIPATARIGMTVQVSVTLGVAKGVLAVLARALQGQPGSYTVLVLGPAGDIQVRPVKVGLMSATYVQITQGVALGEKVILDVAGGVSPTPFATPVPSASVSQRIKKSPSPSSSGAVGSPSGSPSPTASPTP